MIKVGSCTVLYNPDENVLSNLISYIEKVDTFVIVDNSDKKNKYSIQIMNNYKDNYIDMHNNVGIAAALNRGIDELYNRGVDYVLTMDQDSVFPKEYYDEISKLVNDIKDDFSIIGLNFNHYVKDKSDEIVVVPYWITSGNFVNIKDFIKVGKFDEKLFIDYVDFELCFKMYSNNLKVCYLKDYSLIHSIGNPIPINIFGKTYYSMNHSVIRYYYRYRNSYYLFKKNKDFFGKLFIKEILINTPKMLIFEKNRMCKLRKIAEGLRDGSKEKMGKYE